MTSRWRLTAGRKHRDRQQPRGLSQAFSSGHATRGDVGIGVDGGAGLFGTIAGTLDMFAQLNPTALVVPRNNTGGGEAFQSSRGEATGGVQDKTGGGVARGLKTQVTTFPEHYRSVPFPVDFDCSSEGQLTITVRG